jgi:hypothetical protein
MKLLLLNISFFLLFANSHAQKVNDPFTNKKVHTFENKNYKFLYPKKWKITKTYNTVSVRPNYKKKRFLNANFDISIKNMSFKSLYDYLIAENKKNRLYKDLITNNQLYKVDDKHYVLVYEKLSKKHIIHYYLKRKTLYTLTLLYDTIDEHKIKNNRVLFFNSFKIK